MQQLSQKQQQNSKASSRGKELTSIKLRWREEKRAPFEMSRWCDAVVDGNTVYFRNGYKVEIYSYDVTSDSWSQLPDCVIENGSITIVNGWLTTVGGRLQSAHSNELFSLTEKLGSGRRWTKKFPPMPTKRRDSTALCIGTTLIVAGGVGEGDIAMSTVEVMNTENHQWSTAAHLLKPINIASATVCGEQIYMLGGVYSDSTSNKSVYTCLVSALLQSCARSSLEAKIEETSLEDKTSIWRQVADLPVIHSTCESFHRRLLVIGGKTDLAGKATTAVYMYNSTTNSWEIISYMKIARSHCFTTVLPDNQLMVVGGNIAVLSSTDTVELANFCTYYN